MRRSVSETLCLGSCSKRHKAAMVRRAASRRADVLSGSSSSVSQEVCDGIPSERGVMDFTKVASFSSDPRSFAIWQIAGSSDTRKARGHRQFLTLTGLGGDLLRIKHALVRFWVDSDGLAIIRVTTCIIPGTQDGSMTEWLLADLII